MMPVRHREIIGRGGKPVTVIEAHCDRCTADAPFIVGDVAYCPEHFWKSAAAYPALKMHARAALNPPQPPKQGALF